MNAPLSQLVITRLTGSTAPFMVMDTLMRSSGMPSNRICAWALNADVHLKDLRIRVERMCAAHVASASLGTLRQSGGVPHHIHV